MSEEKTCRTCIENEDGFCNRKGIQVKDNNICDKHKEELNWQQAFMRMFLAGH